MITWTARGRRRRAPGRAGAEVADRLLGERGQDDQDQQNPADRDEGRRP
jgi:hypothetical protein